MRQLLLILRIIFIILFILNVSIWIIAQGSGHNIPLRTNLIFGIRSFICLILIIVFNWGGKVKAKNKRV